VIVTHQAPIVECDRANFQQKNTSLRTRLDRIADALVEAYFSEPTNEADAPKEAA